MHLDARPGLRHSRLTRSIAGPLGLLLIALVIFGAIAWLSQRVGHEATRPAAPPFTNPLPAPGANRFIVKQAGASGVSVVAESSKDPASAPVQQLPFSPGLRVELLLPALVTDVKPGDWLAVVGVSNQVRNFSIHALVIIPAGAFQQAGDFATSAAGFDGSEAGPNAADRVVLGGIVGQVAGSTVTLSGGPSPIEVDFTPRAPLYRLAPGAASDVRAGDLVALKGSSLSDPAAAVLVRAPAAP